MAIETLGPAAAKEAAIEPAPTTTIIAEASNALSVRLPPTSIWIFEAPVVPVRSGRSVLSMYA